MNRAYPILILALLVAIGMATTEAGASVFSGSTTPTVKSLATGTQPETIDASEYQRQLNQRFEQVIRNEAYVRSREIGGLSTDITSGSTGARARSGETVGDVGKGFHLGRTGGDIGTRIGNKGKGKDNHGHQKRHGFDEGGGGGGERSVEPAPEPATWILLLSALGAVALFVGPRRIMHS